VSGKSTKSQVIGIRLPNEIVGIIHRRAAKNRFNSVSDYHRERIIYDMTRKHVKQRGQNE